MVTEAQIYVSILQHIHDVDSEARQNDVVEKGDVGVNVSLHIVLWKFFIKTFCVLIYESFELGVHANGWIDLIFAKGSSVLTTVEARRLVLKNGHEKIVAAGERPVCVDIVDNNRQWRKPTLPHFVAQCCEFCETLRGAVDVFGDLRSGRWRVNYIHDFHNEDTLLDCWHFSNDKKTKSRCMVMTLSVNPV